MLLFFVANENIEEVIRLVEIKSAKWQLSVSFGLTTWTKMIEIGIIQN